MGVFDWLNDNQGAIIALLTAVLAFLAFKSMQQTKQALVEARLSRQDATRPVIDFEIITRNGTELLRVKNIGIGPAMNVSIGFSPPKSHEWNLGLHFGESRRYLAAGESTDCGILKRRLAIALAVDEKGSLPDGMATVSYSDAFGRGFASNAAIKAAVKTELGGTQVEVVADYFNRSGSADLGRKLRDLFKNRNPGTCT